MRREVFEKALKCFCSKAKIEEYNVDLENVEIIPLMPYKDYIASVYHALCLVSDSGTAQEEPAFLKTPVIVPRDFSERPESAARCPSMCRKN